MIKSTMTPSVSHPRSVFGQFHCRLQNYEIVGGEGRVLQSLS